MSRFKVVRTVLCITYVLLAICAVFSTVGPIRGLPGIDLVRTVFDTSVMINGTIAQELRMGPWGWCAIDVVNLTHVNKTCVSASSPYIIPLEAGPRGKAGSNQTSSSGQARPNATQLGQRSLILHTVLIVCFAVVGGLQLLYWRNKQLDAIIRHVEYFVIVICLAQFSILGELSAETGALVKPFGGRAFWSTGAWMVLASSGGFIFISILRLVIMGNLKRTAPKLAERKSTKDPGSDTVSEFTV